jgi:polyisoprenoid-binding protein YceI
MRALFLFLPWAVAAQTATYNIRPMQGNRFALEVFKSKLWEGRKHTFLFDRFSGLLVFDREHAERSSVRFVVESGSARCVDDWVKPEQLKDIERAAVQETMAAAAYPAIVFRSTTITMGSPDRYEVRGILTIRAKQNRSCLRYRRRYAKKESGSRARAASNSPISV